MTYPEAALALIAGDMVEVRVRSGKKALLQSSARINGVGALIACFIEPGETAADMAELDQIGRRVLDAYPGPAVQTGETQSFHTTAERDRYLRGLLGGGKG
jgi:hypothetical protein